MDQRLKKILSRPLIAPKTTKDKYLFSAMMQVEISSIGCGITCELDGLDIMVYMDGGLYLVISAVEDSVIFSTKKEDNRILPVVFCVLQYALSCGNMEGYK